MCISDRPPRRRHSLLLTVKSFELEDEKAVRGQSIISTLMTTAVIVAILVGTEMSVRSFFEQFQVRWHWAVVAFFPPTLA